MNYKLLQAIAIAVYASRTPYHYQTVTAAPTVVSFCAALN